MKSLIEYIKEAQSDVAESKTFTFNFANLEDCEETMKSLENAKKDGIEMVIDDKKMTINVTKEGTKNIDAVQDIIQQFIATCNSTTHRASNEGYAQRLASVERTLGSLNDYIDEVEGESESKENPDNLNKNKEEKKDDNKKDDENDDDKKDDAKKDDEKDKKDDE